MLDLSARRMAEMIRQKKTSSYELVKAHLARIEEVQPVINAAVHSLAAGALQEAQRADGKLGAGESCGPLHGVPFSVKDSIDVAGASCTAGTLGRRNAPPAEVDATLVRRLRTAGAIPIVKTNLPDLLFAFETDNYIFGRSNNPYDPARTPGGSSGGEAALIAACGSPLGLGSDCAGSVRLPAAFCGIAGIKPTSGRLPRTGHVPPAGGWIEKLWQIGPMARRVEDLVLAMELLSGEDGIDFTTPPAALLSPAPPQSYKVAFFTENGIASSTTAVRDAVQNCAKGLSDFGMSVCEDTPPCINQAYELEMAILGADGLEGVDAYLREVGSSQAHPLLEGFTGYVRPFRVTTSEFARRWAQWDEYRAGMTTFFSNYDAVICPVYPEAALRHGESNLKEKFEGFSYTMAWNVAGFPAATVRCGESDGLPLNVQVVGSPWRELTVLSVCRVIEDLYGGWKPPTAL